MKWRKSNRTKREFSKCCKLHEAWALGDRLHSARVREQVASVEDHESMADISREVYRSIVCRDDYPDCEDDSERVLLAFQPLIGEALAIAMRGAG